MAKTVKKQDSTAVLESNRPKPITELLEANWEAFNVRPSDKGLVGLSTGYDDLDRITYGLRPGHLIVVAGRPSTGKSVLSMNFAEHVSLNQPDSPVVIFTLEKTCKDLVNQISASLSRVDVERIQTGNLDDDNFARLSSSIGMLTDNSNLYIDDSPTLTPTDISKRSRKLATEHGGISMIVVDSLQLVSPDQRRDTITAELSDITRSLKALAKELNCPVVLVSQLNRYVEQRTDKRPVLSDLRDSGSIEQDADLILFVYRQEMYYPDEENMSLAEIIVGKHTYGPCGLVKLTFAGKYCRFNEPYVLRSEGE